MTCAIIVGMLAGLAITEAIIRRRRAKDCVSAAWWKDRLQLGRENHA